MNSNHPAFEGFNKDAFKFLEQLSLANNNNTKWFDKNRQRYELNLVAPAKLFITDIGQFFNQLNLSIRTEPKFNQTIMRINKDMRFAKGAPYKNYFLIHFGRFKMDSEFYVYFDGSGISYGLFLNNTIDDELFFNENLIHFRKEIISFCEKYKINNKFSFNKLDKEPELVVSKFNMNKHFDLLHATKYILLEKNIKKDEPLASSVNFLSTAVKTFSSLYPLYCFAISKNPQKLIEEYEDRFGIMA